MTKNMNVNGMSLAPGVVETIVSIAANEVEGVASVGSYTAGGIRAKLTAKPDTSGIDVAVTPDAFVGAGGRQGDRAAAAAPLATAPTQVMPAAPASQVPSPQSQIPPAARFQTQP